MVSISARDQWVSGLVGNENLFGPFKSELRRLVPSQRLMRAVLILCSHYGQSHQRPDPILACLSAVSSIILGGLVGTGKVCDLSVRGWRIDRG